MESRGAPPNEPYAYGEILLPGRPLVSCLIAEFSGTGARLEVRSNVGISNTFDLRAFGRIYPVRVIRRMPRTLLVQFD